MLENVGFYHFSPTGGTKKVGEIFCNAFSANIDAVDLMKKDIKSVDADVVVFAAPVIAGRIPKIVADKIKMINGTGKKAVTLAVYGVRAYEDALIELNDVVEACGFQVIASAAPIAQHSMVSAVGAGRPDDQDENEIQNFAKQVLEKLGKQDFHKVEVPGNRPYKDGMTVSATPISTEACNKCGVCEAICPTEAIQISEEVETTLEKCILCMACTAHCPAKARILPPPMQAGMNERLGGLKDVRRENEFFL